MNEVPRQRLFFALWPPPELARQLRRWAQSAFDDPRARLLQADQIHLTLVYLGPSTAEQRDCAGAVAEQVGVAPFELNLTTAGYWPRPRVGWVAPCTTPPALISLVEQFQRQLPDCDYPVEARPWRAHLTLLRKLRRPPVCRELAPPLLWSVSEFSLVESRTRPSGAEYRILRRWPLRTNHGES